MTNNLECRGVGVGLRIFKMSVWSRKMSNKGGTEFSPHPPLYSF